MIAIIRADGKIQTDERLEPLIRSNHSNLTRGSKMAECDSIRVSAKNNRFSCVVCGVVFTQKSALHECCSRKCRKQKYKSSSKDYTHCTRIGKVKDRRGQRFGRLVVIEDVGRKFGGVLWRCKCDCGKTVDVRASCLVCGDAKSCCGKGPCHHSWKGGHKNIGSEAWALKKLAGVRIQSIESGYAQPEKNPEKVIKLWKESNGLCMACAIQPGICLDHCHDTGIIRGFLCSSCNTLIGFAKNSQEILLRCKDYLVRTA